MTQLPQTVWRRVGPNTLTPAAILNERQPKFKVRHF